MEILPPNAVTLQPTSQFEFALSFDDGEEHPGSALSRTGFSPYVINKTHQTGKWSEKLGELGKLKPGWNGYTAPAPAQAAIDIATAFLAVASTENNEPLRIGPSSFGGVGVTFRHASKKVYVECFNDGEIYALFTDGENEPVSRPVNIGRDGFRRILREIKVYLDA